MTTSKTKISMDNEAFVWAWLPGQSTPVVVGKLSLKNELYIFAYGRSYLERSHAISLYDEELPLGAGELVPRPGLSIAGCLRDSAPDAWGRRVILNRKYSAGHIQHDASSLNEITYLLESGSDRIGALDFQKSPSHYEPRESAHPTLEELLTSVEKVERGIPLSSALDQALQHGTSIGGARPKALIAGEQKKYVAKFSSSSDFYNVLKAEFVAMKLAKLCRINVAEVSLTTSLHKDVLLIERFDRNRVKKDWVRKNILSALTLLGLDEMMARYASYIDFAEIIRTKFANPAADLHELFQRMVFNILCGNTDDHARNHAAFWDGKSLALTPAYDICPQMRIGREASQAMFIRPQSNLSLISNCIAVAPSFLLTKQTAQHIIDKQVEIIKSNWLPVCDEAKLNTAERNFLWGRQFLNPFAFEN